jgi:septal ring factor EnvC (AmiA/AmiB activator)
MPEFDALFRLLLVIFTDLSNERREQFDRIRSEFISLGFTIASINQKLEEIMANQQDFQNALARVEAATTAGAATATAIKDRITALEDAIRNAGLSADQEANLLAQIEGVATNAEALAAALQPMGQPNNPVPVEPPAPLEPVTPA